MGNLQPRTMVRIRIGCYTALFLWSSLLVFVATLRLVYTLDPRRDRRLVNEEPFYDHSIVELWISAALSIPFSLLIIFVLLCRKRLSTLSRNWFELTSLVILWCLWLGGAASSTSFWPDIGLCYTTPCSVLNAILAFSWVGFATLTFLLFPALYYVARFQAWDHHAFEQWTPRPVIHEDRTFAEQKDIGAREIVSWTYETQVESRVSYRLSTFTDILPWLVWSEHSTPFSSNEGSILPTSRGQKE